MSILHQVALTYIKNIGPYYAKSIISHLGSADRVFTVSPSKLLKIEGIGEKRADMLNRQVLDDSLRKADEELKFIEKNNIDVIFYTDPRYPKRLKQCNDSPLLLYSKGNADLNMQRSISIVGTRNATEYGKQLCRQLVEELQPYNVLVISGLAYGIDTCAHKECVRLGVPTVGVLGHGLDKLYPAANRSTAEKMIENGGGLLTEYPSGTKPDRENFPQRNRIVAGMADATIVVEAGIKGGALITAEIANSYNRDVFAFPGRIGDDYSEGCNFLIRHNKASLLMSAADLAYSLGWEKSGKSEVTEQLTLPLDLSSDEQLIFEIIRAHKAPLAIDDLTLKTNMPMSQLAMNLLNMEMQGYIRSLPGKTYVVN